jgi:hypothetical protein
MIVRDSALGVVAIPQETSVKVVGKLHKCVYESAHHRERIRAALRRFKNLLERSGLLPGPRAGFIKQVPVA